MKRNTQDDHNYTAAQVTGLIEAVEDGRMEGIQIVRKTAKNNAEMVTFVAL